MPLRHFRVDGLSYSYPDGNSGINDISFSLERGTLTVITGLSAVYTDDGERLRKCLPVFDALYSLFGKGEDGRRGEKATIKRRTVRSKTRRA